MKKLIFGLGMVLLVVTNANAETIEITTSDRQVRVEARSEVRGERQERRSIVAENHANRLERRFKLYYERMSRIMEKFQQRLDFLKDQGKDVTTVQTKLDSAKAKLEEARKKGDEAIAAFRAIDPAKWEEQKPQIVVARDLAKAARGLYLETKELLKDALKELKTIVKPALPARERGQ